MSSVFSEHTYYTPEGWGSTRNAVAVYHFLKKYSQKRRKRIMLLPPQFRHNSLQVRHFSKILVDSPSLEVVGEGMDKDLF